ncbi:hypothetical protein CDL12_11677 [Handroanthus impetiginosus]|uniref:Uncharacterized protein n=1 Tax=Handroanthus impetiginosus TaxID=429701 RepID=A0A2G9HEG9_9LAMI|nr:hypothetical protein CDL12_11677 [Handroanthus impetiginosus]
MVQEVWFPGPVGTYDLHNFLWSAFAYGVKRNNTFVLDT